MSVRKLQLRARAERMAQTRERIVRATYELHRDVGAAFTTISAIAERAGVQRLTVYHHFRDEVELFGACTVYGLALDPMPEPTVLASITAPEERLREALTQQYAYYRRNTSLMANALRDLPIVQERMRVAGLTEADVPDSVRAVHSQPERLRGVLMHDWDVRESAQARLAAALGLALDFHSWSRLVGGDGLADAAAVDLMVHFVKCAAVDAT